MSLLLGTSELCPGSGFHLQNSFSTAQQVLHACGVQNSLETKRGLPSGEHADMLMSTPTVGRRPPVAYVS